MLASLNLSKRAPSDRPFSAAAVATVTAAVYCSHNEPSSPSPTSWTLAIRSAAEGGRSCYALSLYVLMLRSGFLPDAFAAAVALKACARLPSSSFSKTFASSIHAQLHKLGFHSHVYPQTALADLYSKLEDFRAAGKVFDHMPTKNIVSWNSRLASYLRAGKLEAARRVFDEMPVKDIVSWNTMLSGYAKSGKMEFAAELFDRMPERNPASWNGMISGYVSRGNMTMSRELFDSMPVRSNVSWVTMISGYSQSCDLSSAREVFNQMETKDIFVWNSMIACYAQNGRPREAIYLFNRMRKPDLGVQPNEMTFSSVISACSQLGNLQFGLWTQEYMHSLGIVLDDHLSTALIDLHLKSGVVDMAFKLFKGLRRRDIVSYSAMILGCGINGRPDDAICLFEEMVNASIAPNAATYIGLLVAYNHAGLVEEGRKCFESMLRKHKIKPSADHYAIMVDLLGRSGKLEEAVQLIKQMQVQAHAGVWGALLLACRLHRNVEIGELAARNCFELEPKESGYYVLLASIYSEAGKWDKAKRLRKVMQEKGLTKMLGCSWVQTT